MTELAELWAKGKEKRLEFKAAHPELGSLPYQEQLRLWREFLGIKTSLRPSVNDSSREAECPVCRDNRYIYRSGLRFDDPGWGKSIPCPACSHLDNLRRENAGLPAQEKTFESFKIDRAPGMQEAYDWARVVAETEQPPWLVFTGKKGCGKTHLAMAMAKVLLDKGRRVRWWYVPSLLDELRATFREDSAVDMREAMRSYAEIPDWLFLDELGGEKPSLWVQERLEMVINLRYQNKRGLVVTSNVAKPELAERLPRVVSRFGDGEMCLVVACRGEDFRPKLRRAP